MEVRIKKIDQLAVIPFKAHKTDAGFDLVATTKGYDEYGNVVYGTGLCFEIPEGYVGLLFPRSSVCKSTLSLTNAVGVIDSCYRGEVTMKFKPTVSFAHDGYAVRMTAADGMYEVGDRIGQLIIVPYPEIEFKVVDELSDTDRGANGYGSSGR